MKIAFHDNMLSIRGTTVAIYDYAFYNREFLKNESIILYDVKYSGNNKDVHSKFSKEFKTYGYNHISEIDEILSKEKCDYLFSIKGGKFDGVISNFCKNLVMAVSSNISKNDIHGDKYFVCSPFLTKKTGIDFVPHMINLPEVEGNLRSELKIPEDAIVFGRNGGYETFDLPFVKTAIKDILNQKENYYFVFQNTERFIEHSRVLFIAATPDMNFKVKFINTCDAHLHARHIGESFGLTCGEFSVKNKPIITWNGSFERNHIDILGDKALLYNSYDDLMHLLLTFDKDKFDDWNCYREYLPGPVMDKFKEMYL
jgi:hypothetical protein